MRVEGIPVSMEIDGERVIVGEATMEQSASGAFMACIEVDDHAAALLFRAKYPTGSFSLAEEES
jgi:hypothetical protein